MGDRDQVVADALRELDDVPEHRPGFWTELHERLALEAPAVVPVRRQHLGSSRWLAIAAAVVVLAGGALVALRSGGGESGVGPTPPATTPGPTITTVSSVQGVLVTSTPGEATQRWTFALDQSGRFASRQDDGTSIVEDPVEGISVNTVPGGETYRMRGTALGLLGLLRRDVGWSVAALAAARDPRVITAEQDGRPVWVFDADVEPNKLAGDLGVDHIYAAVDRASQVPLVLRSLSRGRVVAEQHVEGLKIGAGIPPGTFDVAAPEHAIAENAGWRRVDPATADVPRIEMPAGYALAEVAVHDEPLAGGPEGANPATGPATAYAFRRGVDVLVVTVQPAGSAGNVWDDPLGAEGIVAGHPVTGVERGGVVVDVRAVPHAWGVGGGRVVTVAGAASGDELVTALRSLLAP
jgi:hypothetical protein